MDAHADGLSAPHPARAAKARAWYDLPLLAILFGLFLLAALLLTRLTLVAFEVFVRDADKSADPSPIELTIAGIPLHVPRNMVRAGVERAGSRAQLDLHVHWPTLEGFSLDRAAQFRSGAAATSLIYVTIRPADAPLSPDERFRRVYPRVLAEATRRTTEGYVVRGFRPGHGYDGEELYIARDPERPLAARCEVSDNATSATCITEFRSELGLDVTYRFRRALLSDWRTLDERLRDLIESFAQAKGE